MEQEIIHGDSLEVMREYEENQFDLALTDPPYGIGENKEKHDSRGGMAETTEVKNFQWDGERISEEYIQETRRISKNQIIFGGNYYTDILPPTSCWVVWDKRNGENDFSDCELAWASYDRGVRQIRWRWNGMLQEKGAGNKEDDFRLDKRVHPTQKPVAVMRKILKLHFDGGTVIDPFVGSGTVCLACKQLGIEAVGIDKKEEYVHVAHERLSEQPQPLTQWEE